MEFRVRGLNNKRTREEQRLGLTIHRPVRKTRGGEQVTQPIGASGVRGFPKAGGWDRKGLTKNLQEQGTGSG